LKLEQYSTVANFATVQNEGDRFVENQNETLLIKRSNSKGAVLISLQEYNSIMETLHLLRSKSNSKWLFDSIQQMEKGDIVSNQLID
jgi:antitoxin YefM